MKATHLSCSLAASALAFAMLGGCSDELGEEPAQAVNTEQSTQPAFAPEPPADYQEPTPAERRLQWVNKPFSSNSDEGAAAAGTAATEAPASDSL